MQWLSNSALIGLCVVAITLVMGLGLSGIVAPCAFQGAMNGHVFGLYMAEQMLPQLPPNAIVVVDNLSAHHSEDAREALEAHDFERWRTLPGDCSRLRNSDSIIERL